MTYVVKSSLTNNYALGMHANGHTEFTSRQQDAARFSTRADAEYFMNLTVHPQLRIVKLVPKATPMPVASPVAPVPDVLQVLTVSRQGREFIGTRIASELVRLHIDAAQVISIVPILTRSFGSDDTRETSMAQVFYRRK